MSEQNTPVAANPSGSTAGVRRTVATQSLDSRKCEIAIHIGVFFDGTGNALDGNGNTDAQWQHEDRRKHSNVARLFRAYPDQPSEGYFRMYVPGLGTPFPQIGEHEPALFGLAAGEGGDGRINYGLIHVLNSAHRAISAAQRPMFTADTIQALCRNGPRDKFVDEFGNASYGGLEASGDEAALKRVEMDAVGGLLLKLGGSRSHAEAFYKSQSSKLENLIANVAVKPKLKEIFIDVFGFSRGATEARAFCSWLDKMFVGGRLFGVAAQIRFLGIFDTVASVGLNASARIGGQGHFGWADAEYLRIPSRVGHCEHHVAMHENRPSFPLEFVEVDGAKLPNCRQFAYPGMHSDVGGGYRPGEQGRWLSIEDLEPGKAGGDVSNAFLGVASLDQAPQASIQSRVDVLDGYKLSQISLNHMSDAAKAAGVPLGRAVSRRTGLEYDSFTIHPLTQRAFDEFMANDPAEKPLREWLVPYLAWRYRVRRQYAHLSTTLRSSVTDRDDLTGANGTLLLDIDAVENAGLWQALKDELKVSLGLFFARSTLSLASVFATRTARAGLLAPEASAVLARVKAHPPLAEAQARMFMFLCHDSYAGFRPFDQVTSLGVHVFPGSWEGEGYLRYRRRYEGDSRSLTRREPSSPESLETWPDQHPVA